MGTAAQSAKSLWTRLGEYMVCAGAVLGCLPRRVALRRREKRLHLRETLSLGEKRFLAVVEFERHAFLVGGTGSSIALLARLDAEPTSHRDTDFTSSSQSQGT